MPIRNEDRVYLDGANIFDVYGVFITDGGHNGLISYPPLKAPISNNWPEEDGIEVDLSKPVLDSKEFSISFAAVGNQYGAANVAGFINHLSAGAYHLLQLPGINQDCRLRLLSQPSIQVGQQIELFTLQFADDFPLNNYNYLAPNGSVPESGYTMDLKPLSDYGITVLQGSYEEIKKTPPVKKNLTRKFAAVPGALYDDYSVKFQSKEVTLSLLLTAPSINDFWRNYNAFLYDLIRPEPRLMHVSRTGLTYECFYKKSAVSKFSPDGKVWCLFSVTLEFIGIY